MIYNILINYFILGPGYKLDLDLLVEILLYERYERNAVRLDRLTIKCQILLTPTMTTTICLGKQAAPTCLRR